MARISLLLVLAGLAGCSGRGAARPAAPTARSAAAASAVTQAPSARGGVRFIGRDLPLEQVLVQSRSSGRPAMLYFATSWCGYCRMLEQQTLPDPTVAAHMAAYTNAQYDADSSEGRALAKRYGVLGFPTFVAVDAAGNRQGFYEGYDAPSDFVRRIPRP